MCKNIKMNIYVARYEMCIKSALKTRTKNVIHERDVRFASVYLCVD